MGKRLSCCKNRTQSLFKRKESSLINLTSELKYDETILSLQHISEREIKKITQDPSINPTAGPLFVERSLSDDKSNYFGHKFYHSIFN